MPLSMTVILFNILLTFISHPMEYSHNMKTSWELLLADPCYHISARKVQVVLVLIPLYNHSQLLHCQFASTTKQLKFFQSKNPTIFKEKIPPLDMKNVTRIWFPFLMDNYDHVSERKTTLTVISLLSLE